MLNFTKKTWQIPLKILALAFVGIMMAMQFPELSYDLGSKTPISITGPEALAGKEYKNSVFASIQGSPNFERAFVYRRYGLSYTYFSLDPYGVNVVVRTYGEVTDDWKKINRFLGKLRPFDNQPFSYRIREIYKEKFDMDILEDAYFLSLGEVPRVSAFQLGATVLSGMVWLGLLYGFFLHRRFKAFFRALFRA